MSTRALIAGGVGGFALGLSLVSFRSNFPDSDLIKLFAAAWQPEIVNGVNKFALALTACVFIFAFSLNVVILLIRPTPSGASAQYDASRLSRISMIVSGVSVLLIGGFLGGIIGGQIIFVPALILALHLGFGGLAAALFGVSFLVNRSEKTPLLVSLGLICTVTLAPLVGEQSGISFTLTSGVIISGTAGLLGMGVGLFIAKWIGESLEHGSA